MLGPCAVICACMNREAMLRISLASWLNSRQVTEIWITDWCSDSPLNYLEASDPRIKVIRVNGHPHFNLAKAYNLALRAATAELIVKVDVDYVLNPYFDMFSELELNQNEFFTGHWQLGQFDNELGFLRYTNGFIVASRAALVRVNGYNEELVGYGHDDDDLYSRLHTAGFVRKVLLLNKRPYIYHNPHEDGVRSANYEHKDLEESRHRNIERTRR